MDIITFALCKKMSNGLDSELITNKIEEMEAKLDGVQTDTILAELKTVRNELAQKVSAETIE